ncbi:MAG: L-threonylcarbamoyladenylate synthase [Bacteroidota bacterium]
MKRFSISEAAYEAALEALKTGQVIALPTDTAYGLAASWEDETACRMIYQIKDRAMDQPLILLADSLELLLPFCVWNQAAQRLADEFWPGALTLILPATDRVPFWVNSGGSTIGVRIPAHPVPRHLSRELQAPLATTSANRSGQPSPRSGDAVWDQLHDSALALLLDDGSTVGSADSTIVDLVGRRILRAGGIPPETIQEVFSL